MKKQNYQKQRQEQARREQKQKKKKLRIKIKKPTFKGKELIFQITKTINHFFPDFCAQIEALEDPRIKKGSYSLSGIILASIMMFVLKQGSRNAMNEARTEGGFKENYFNLFGKKIPHRDTVDEVLRNLNEKELTTLKAELIPILLSKKVMHGGRFLGNYYSIADEGTGIHSFAERHCAHGLTMTGSSTLVFIKGALKQLTSEGIDKDILKLLRKMKSTTMTFKADEQWKDVFEEKPGRQISEEELELIEAQIKIKPGKTRYFHNVLEAKLICSNGFSLSLGSEWIENESVNQDKQDGEAKAFKRLSEYIKKLFSQLKTCVITEGLYPNGPFFKMCKKNNWRFICTFKDGNLPRLQDKIEEELGLNSHNTLSENSVRGGKNSVRVYRWLKGLAYCGTQLSWLECVETTTNSKGKVTTTHLTSEEVDCSTVAQYVTAGRLRQKIENEGFNTQKTGGYELEHTFSRISLIAAKNDYQCTQIAHLINQLCVLSQPVQKKLSEWTTTLKHCWVAMMGYLMHGVVNKKEWARFLSKRTQYQYSYLP